MTQLESDVIKLLEAAKYLLLSSKGPTDGPTNHEEIKARWMLSTEYIIKKMKES